MESKYDALSLRLILSDGLRDELAQRCVDETDVRQVISYAESTSKKLMDTDTQHLVAHLKIDNITCWVEYMPEGDEYRVFGAYTHRLAIEEEY